MSPTRKITCLLSVIFLLVSLGFSPSPAAEHVRVEVLSDSEDRLVLRYHIGDYESNKVNIGGLVHDEILLPGEPVFLEAGAPSLPHVNRSVVIPDDAEMELRVLETGFYEISARVAPSKGNLSRKVDPDKLPHEFGEAYGIDAFYPGAVAGLHRPYVLRDRRGIVVQVNPFQYNPVTTTLRVYKEITVEVSTVGPGKANVLERTRSFDRESRAFEEIYGAHFLNHVPPAERDFVEEGSMLIICNDPWIDNMAPFVAHKAAVGIGATVVGISTIGNTTTAIQDYIQGVYDGGNLSFVLLVGDIDQIASPNVYAGEDGASDPSYSKLAGDDDYPDILVGRFSANSAAEVDTQVQRTIEYEATGATEQDWFWRGTGIASDEGAGAGDEGQSDIEHEDEIRAWLLGAGYTLVDQIYDPGATDAEVAAALNAGRGVLNYTGHGYSGGVSSSGFNTADVNALANTGMLPFVVLVACNTGEFENYDTCFGEAWLRATHDGEPAGAVAVYASSVSQYWAPPMEGQDQFNLLLTDPAQPFHSFGGLCFAGSMSMMDAYGSSGVDMFNTWIVFGDPSLRVIGTPIPPTGMKVTPQGGLSGAGAAGGEVTPADLLYTVTNFDEAPLELAATPTVPWVTATPSSTTIPPGESIEVAVSFNLCACNMDHGDYAGTIDFVNLTTHEGDTTREVALSVGAPALRDQYDLDTDPGWTTEGLWEFGVPMGDGGNWGFGGPDPTAGATGSNVFGAKLAGDVPPSIGGPYHLTMGPLSFAGTDSVVLKFQRWLNTESNPPRSATVEVSDDGSTWSQVWSNVADVTDSAWTPMAYDISDVAAGSDTIWMRWGYGVNASGAHFCSGWNIDDVELWTSTASVRVELTTEAAQLSWTSSSASSFDVVMGDLTTLRGSGGDFSLATDTCLGNDLGANSVAFDETPLPGEGRWFLVRGVSAAGPSTYQSLTGSTESRRDAEINAAAASCP